MNDFIQEWSEMPNYSVIIDTRDRLIPQLAYVVEENIELGEGRVWFLIILSDIFIMKLIVGGILMDYNAFRRSTGEK